MSSIELGSRERWKEDSRYDAKIDKKRAGGLYSAITNNKHGGFNMAQEILVKGVLSSDEIDAGGNCCAFLMIPLS